MSVRIYLAWYDMLVGVYVNRLCRCVYICPLPCVLVRIGWGGEGGERG